MTDIKILIIPGSLRSGSYNKRLAAIAGEELKKFGAAPTTVDLREYPMPIFDEDYESSSGQPETVKRLKELFLSHPGHLYVCPEYNSSITAVLKNTIDWLSRPVPNEPPLAAFSGKVTGLLSASPGALGGLRGLVHVRSILGNIGAIVLPAQYALSSADKMLGSGGNDADPKVIEGLKKVIQPLVSVTAKLFQ